MEHLRIEDEHGAFFFWRARFLISVRTKELDCEREERPCRFMGSFIGELLFLYSIARIAIYIVCEYYAYFFG